MNAPARVTLLALLVAAALALPLGLEALARRASSARGPCPNLPRSAQPSAFHFSPGLVEHQSWIEFPVPERDATHFVLCLDGRLLSSGVGQTPEGGRVRASLRTTWVDLQWILGRLDRYRDPARWQLRYTLYSLGHR